MPSHLSTTPVYSTPSYQAPVPLPPPVQQQQQFMTVPASYHSMPQQQVPVQQQQQPPRRRVPSHEEQKQMLRSIMSGQDYNYYDGDYVPTSTPPAAAAAVQQQDQQMQITPAGWNHSAPVRNGKRSYESTQTQNQDRYFPPDRNTKVDSDWLNHEKFGKYFSHATKSSFMRASDIKLNGWTGDTDHIPFHILAPDYWAAWKSANMTLKSN